MAVWAQEVAMVGPGQPGQGPTLAQPAYTATSNMEITWPNGLCAQESQYVQDKEMHALENVEITQGTKG